MEDDKDVDAIGSSNPDLTSSTDQTAEAAAIPEESGAEEGAESGHENQAASSSSTIQTEDPLETMSRDDPLGFIFELRKRLGSLNLRAPLDDQGQPPRGPASRKLPPEYCLCFRKRLNLTDASHDDGRLDIGPLQAIWIPVCPHIPKKAHDESKSVELKVFDYENTQYNMVLTAYNYEGIVLYSINGEWRKFIRAHNLQHGDLIFFCKNLDARINGDDFYYVILFAKRSGGDFMFVEDDDDEEESGEDGEGKE